MFAIHYSIFIVNNTRNLLGLVVYFVFHFLRKLDSRKMLVVWIKEKIEICTPMRVWMYNVVPGNTIQICDQNH